MYYQYYGKADLLTPAVGGWALGEVQYSADTNDLLFAPILCTNPPTGFFRAVGAGNEARIQPDPYFFHAIEPSGPSTSDGVNAQFHVTLQQTAASDVTIFYSMSRTAANGLDYTISGVGHSDTVGSVVISAGNSEAPVVVQAKYDPNIDFDEFAVFSLVPTNGYVVDPSYATTSITISDHFGTNLFGIVATNDPSWGWAVALDYFAPSNCLVLSVNYADTRLTGTYPGAPCNFALLDTSHIIAPWSVVTNVGQYWMEINIATAKATTNGYAIGDLFFGNWTSDGYTAQAYIGRVSASGLMADPLWVALPNETDQVSGSLHLDQTGVWGYDLLVVTGQDGDYTGTTRGIWRVNPATQTATQVTRIPAAHLEGALTVPNDSAYGPWAGKLLTGDEYQKVIYAVAPDGSYTPYPLGISPDTFRLIPGNQDLYCCAISGAPQCLVLKLSRQLLAPYVGDILIIQSGEVSEGPPAVVIAHWDGVSFRLTTILLGNSLPGYSIEHAVFAPTDIPAFQP